jgi:deoxyuridine 5'-triphosphate nucleotidohydrolase
MEVEGMHMQPDLKIHVLPGGKLPARQTDGAVGYDVCIRALVSPHEMDPDTPHLRKTLFDFQTFTYDPQTNRQVWRDDSGRLAYRMEPQESVLVGVGFLTEMPFPMFYSILPRSGLTSKMDIDVRNLSIPIDPDYRGEAGALVYNRGAKPFDLYHGMRIGQIVFLNALIPAFTEVATPQDLNESRRGVNSHGSTGLK